ncbi:hypothetical protein [Mycolicibacterium hippocampi]|uniref:Uncharacterized protein n=1 Tax=Mycolicibacterium hippocampi TaxID=659824 RepID=A0A850PSH0_9MYCO|nr:hypothetical protein [Mycolicibacterium hippocampi]NVN53259.1 hypothetical protein [Mycolicibacterium hippocampi]
MITVIRGLAAGTMLAAAAVALAAPAAAQPLEGMYSITVTNGAGIVENGAKEGAFVSPCGPDCSRFVTSGWSTDARLQGNTWSGVTTAGLILSFDKDSLAGTMVKGPQVVGVQLIKVG